MNRRLLTIGATALAVLAAAGQSVAPSSPEQALHVTTLPGASDADLGVVALTNGVPALFEFSAVTNSVVTPTPLSNSNNTMEAKTVTAANGTMSRPAKPQITPLRSSSIGLGGRIPLPDGISAVTINSKGFSCRVAGYRVGLQELRLTFTNNVVRRNSLLFVGQTSLRTPLPVEGVEMAGGVFLILAFLAVTGLLWQGLSRRHLEPDAPPNNGPHAGSPNGTTRE